MSDHELWHRVEFMFILSENSWNTIEATEGTLHYAEEPVTVTVADDGDFVFIKICWIKCPHTAEDMIRVQERAFAEIRKKLESIVDTIEKSLDDATSGKVSFHGYVLDEEGKINVRRYDNSLLRTNSCLRIDDYEKMLKGGDTHE